MSLELHGCGIHAVCLRHEWCYGGERGSCVPCAPLRGAGHQAALLPRSGHHDGRPVARHITHHGPLKPQNPRKPQVVPLTAAEYERSASAASQNWVSALAVVAGASTAGECTAAGMHSRRAPSLRAMVS